MVNVVLVCTDQWRGDCLGVAGHDVVHTPFLDEFASGGVRAESAYSPAPTCVPARMSLLTGLTPSHHRRVGYEDGIPFDVATTLASAFSESGYQTQAIGKMHVYPERASAGFDNVILHDGYLHASRKNRPDVRFYDDYTTWLRTQPGSRATDDEYSNGVQCNAVVARPWERPEYQHPTTWATDQAIDWLYRRDPTRPFFLFLSYHRPHAPYNPPQWAWDLYAERDVPGDQLDDNWSEELFSSWENNDSPQSVVAHYDATTVTRARRGYYGNMSHIDAQFKRFMEALSDFGLSEDTVVCFTSDHGDMMGDHGLWRKGLPYEGSAHIPLIIAGPGIAPGVTTQLCDLTDIMPTLLDAASLPIPEGIDGLSLLSRLRNRDNGTEPAGLTGRDYLHGEHVLLGQSFHWIIYGGCKYIWHSGSGVEQLFRLSHDPQERTDLLRGGEIGAEDQRSLEACRALLISTLEGREEGFVSDEALRPGRPVVTVLKHAAHQECTSPRLKGGHA